MGDYVYGSGEVTLKKELSAVNFSQIQEGLKKKKDDLDMVELTFRIRLDATNKSSIMEINEGSDSVADIFVNPFLYFLIDIGDINSNRELKLFVIYQIKKFRN